MRYYLGDTLDNTEEILAYSGCHPAFIQMAASEYWNANNFGFAPNEDAIKQTLRGHYQYLWEHRSQAERELLRKIANQKIPKDNSILMTLRQRGLVDAENKLFARFFGEVITTD